MKNKILDGKLISSLIKTELAKEVDQLKKQGRTPKLTIIQVGENKASTTYVNSKKKLSEEVGSICEIIKMEENITTNKLLDKVNELNIDKSVDGILVQLPLPNHIDEQLVIDAIAANKDVDCFHPLNVGKLWVAKDHSNLIKPCTPAGIIEMLHYAKINLSGKKIVILNRSNIVGKPLISLFLNLNATVTICHTKTIDLKKETQKADILVVATGQPKMIDSSYIKNNAIVIDVGINRDVNNKLCGDVNYDEIIDKVSLITPVPGGVGPMTVTMLLKNLIMLAKVNSK